MIGPKSFMYKEYRPASSSGYI